MPASRRGDAKIAAGEGKRLWTECGLLSVAGLFIPTVKGPLPVTDWLSGRPIGW